MHGEGRGSTRSDGTIPRVQKKRSYGKFCFFVVFCGRRSKGQESVGRRNLPAKRKNKFRFSDAAHPRTARSSVQLMSDAQGSRVAEGLNRISRSTLRRTHSGIVNNDAIPNKYIRNSKTRLEIRKTCTHLQMVAVVHGCCAARARNKRGAGVTAGTRGNRSLKRNAAEVVGRWHSPAGTGKTRPQANPCKRHSRQS